MVARASEYAKAQARTTAQLTAAALGALRGLPGASVALFDTDLRCLLVSGSAAGGAGVKAADLEGQLIADALPPHRWGEWESLARAALRGEANSLEWNAPDRRCYRVDVLPQTVPVRRAEDRHRVRP